MSKNNDYLWTGAIAVVIFCLVALISGRSSPNLGMAAGTLTATGVKWLYRRYQGKKQSDMQ
ncbi:MAG: hypothetical protein ABIY70_01705 [Capsulimonas sp.]|uniref:hypothetical protein n=1 Tax=Capsulimonas sp. TaxID=2494211 RepID=UPI0032639C09